MVDQTKARADIIAEIRTTAQKALADHAATLPVTHEENGQKVQSAMVNGEPLMLNHLTVDGVTVSQYKGFYANFIDNMP